MGDFRIDREKLYIKDSLYIPENDELKICVLQQHHNLSEQEYLDYKSIFQSMQNRYFQLDMAKTVRNSLSTVACAAGQKHIIFKNKIF